MGRTREQAEALFKPLSTPEPQVESVTASDPQSEIFRERMSLLGKLGELQEKPGVIRGSKLERWADLTLQRSRLLGTSQ